MSSHCLPALVGITILKPLVSSAQSSSDSLSPLSLLLYSSRSRHVPNMHISFHQQQTTDQDQLKFSGFFVLSTGVLWDKHRTFPSSAFCPSYVLKRMLDFLYQIKLLIISRVFNFSKISMLIPASYLSSFVKCKNYSF